MEDNPRPAKPATDSRSDLLGQIRAGVALKSVENAPNKGSAPPSEDGMAGMAGALSRALMERSKAIHSDSESEDDDAEDEDDDWDDWLIGGGRNFGYHLTLIKYITELVIQISYVCIYLCTKTQMRLVNFSVNFYFIFNKTKLFEKFAIVLAF